MSGDPVQTRPRHFLPQFSLLTVLLLTAIAAMALVIALFWHEIGPLRTEVRQLRNEVGKLTIDDTAKPAVILVHSNTPFTWKWRIWVPAGHSYRVRWCDAAIPRIGFPTAANGTLALDGPREYVVTYRIQDDGWSTLDAAGETVRGNQQNWVAWPSRSIEGESVDERTETYDLGKPIVLIRMRVSNQNGSVPTMADPADGFMIWIEPIK
jgi:hypothetical protein